MEALVVYLVFHLTFGGAMIGWLSCWYRPDKSLCGFVALLTLVSMTFRVVEVVRASRRAS